MYANKYNFTDEAQAQEMLDAQRTLDEEGNAIDKTFKASYFQGFEVITPATYDEESGDELIPATMGTDYYVQIQWKDTQPTEWADFEVTMDGEQSAWGGVLFEERSSRLARLIAKGVVIANGDQSYWFDKETLNDFITMKNNIKDVGATSIEWKATDKKWYVIPMAEADTLAVTGQLMMQQIYKDN